jgi:uncharacterized protein (DUF849 family)|tara:strand:+ start:1659 stop:1973 length:315 start_codon:yes stop_codon:yes gene_type:complete
LCQLSSAQEKFCRLIEGLKSTAQLVGWLAGEMLKYNVMPEIAAFDLSHIHQAVALSKQGKLKAPLYVQFVMGVKNVMPADKHSFDFIETLKRLAPDAQGGAAQA